MTSARQAKRARACLQPLEDLDDDAIARLRVVATDIDGTLTRAGALRAELLTAFEALGAAGVQLIPISGRPAGEVLGLCRYLPGVEFGVAENGLFEIVPDHAPRWLGEPTQLDRLVAVGEHLNREHAAKLRRTGDAFCRLGDVAYERDGREEGELERLRVAAEAEGVCLIWSTVHIHLAERVPDKGAGLLALFAEREIDPRAVVTIGDSPNDVGLFAPHESGAARFGLTVGTADVPAKREWFAHLPERVTRQRELDGFLELSARLLATR
ncbi:HAD-superfamily hydrolase, subfamily IIB [Plesiocystis pacifica SIR-1]|uniref:HAD-superfamily hydrolase, subfamily IIB n=1 Tax=Plesiocystis pacifica SIR-1 TaxID=391625 RepID=A6G7J0_9BACT|nr:hypothetical protein [Plesiocystis pacifica]EDM78199.1 HAD-superfamily hydrolase, subfamily IIB [Plesiocystis pacifica SIR-1]